MKNVYFSPCRLISTAPSTEEKIDLLSEQLERLRDELE